MKKVAIVIPIYRSVTPDEQISLNHLNKFLKSYDLYLVIPNSLDAKRFNKIRAKKIIRFASENFANLRTYSSLLNTKDFYQPFTNYEYILIYQLDTLVFSDQLNFWCNKGYDYIGAPFFNPKIGRLSYKLGSPISGGNGGFSLRRVSSFIKVIELAEGLAIRGSDDPLIRRLWFILSVLTGKSHDIWLKAKPKDYPFNEDGFWSYEASKYYPKFKVAPFKEALQFSFERFPEKCFELNGENLPFGCHAWTRYDQSFWEKYLLLRY